MLQLIQQIYARFSTFKTFQINGILFYIIAYKSFDQFTSPSSCNPTYYFFSFQPLMNNFAPHKTIPARITQSIHELKIEEFPSSDPSSSLLLEL